MQSFVSMLCYVWRNIMKYEILTCEIVKMDVTDVISTSLNWGNGGVGELPTYDIDKM